MSDPYDLSRFGDAQARMYPLALAELRAGEKESHWMWYVFPQLKGLGFSSTAQHYGLAGLDEARRLDRYVQNLLDMTRIEYGALRPRRSAVDVRELIGTARAELAGVLAGHRVEVDFPAGLPRLDVDPVLIGQAISNVLENAAKYAPAGTTIGIAAAVEPGHLLLRISDDGPGIPPAERAKVFDLFYRIGDGDRRPSGTGLGLAIVRGFVEAHGGAVRALPGPQGRGTTIEMELPTAQ